MLHNKLLSLAFFTLALAEPGFAVAPSELAPVSFIEQPVAPASFGSVSIESELLSITNDARLSIKRKPLETHEGLAAVASAHARDMAENGYVGFTGPTGLSLFDQVRMSDRTALTGAIGSSIAVLAADATAAEIHAAVRSDAVNAKNLRRRFSHAGMGTHVSGGKIYVVQLFVKIEGELDQPLPLQLAETTVLKPSGKSAEMTPVAWSLTDKSGERVARGQGSRLKRRKGEPVEGYLNLDFAVGRDVFTVRGPFVQLN